MGNYWKFGVSEGIAELKLDCPGTEINVLNFECIDELDTVLQEISRRQDFKVILITSAKKRIFIAGADIREFGHIQSKQHAVELAEKGKTILQRLEDLKVPTIAVINGACLGGGYELALACSRRVAAKSDSVKVGLPEVNLGILPGFGGSIRLPRLLGLKTALPLMLSGRMVGVKEAKKKGMIDEVFDESNLLEQSRQYAKTLAPQSKRQLSKFRVSWLDRFLIGPLLIYPTVKKEIMKKTKGFYPAPLKIAELVQKTYGRNLGESFKKESVAFSELALTEVSKNLIKLFFLTERYKKLKWTNVTAAVSKTERVGIVGAGIMGGGIAQLVSSRDIPSEVKDISEKALVGARKEAERIYEGALRHGKISKSELDRKMDLIHIGAGNEDLTRCDFIIEAVVEDLEIKKKVFKEMTNVTSAKTICASNTSSLSLTQMAEVSKFPERVVGLHFFNPVHRMPLVEVIRATQTSEETLERTIQFARTLGKTVIVVKDTRGFLVNRLLLPYLNEATFLLEDGVSCREIDGVIRSFGLPMGPLELIDQIGVDTCHKVAHILRDDFGPRMEIAALTETIKNQGFLGKKTGAGFYQYNEKKQIPNPNLKLPEKKSKNVDRDEIIKRLLYIMINEAAYCIGEKVIDSAATVDIGMILGIGFPPFRAGLLRYADFVGTQQIAEHLKRYQQQTGSIRFAPSPYLADLARSNRNFYSE